MIKTFNAFRLIKTRQPDYFIPGLALLVVGIAATSLKGSSYSSFIIIGLVFMALGLRRKKTSGKHSRVIVIVVIMIELISAIGLAYFSQSK
jgi:glucose dehydrogenase